MKDIQDIIQSALVTAFLFINAFVIDFLFFGEGILNQFNAYLFSSTFLVGVIYIRLRMIGLDLEDVQKQLKNPENPVVDDLVSIRSTVESLKDEITTIRSYSVIGIENPAVNGLKREISTMHAELKDGLANLVNALAKR